MKDQHTIQGIHLEVEFKVEETFMSDVSEKAPLIPH